MSKVGLIYSQLKKYNKMYLIALMLVLVDAAVTYIYPMALEKMIDDTLPFQRWNRLFEQILLLGGCQLLSILVAVILSYIFCKITNGFIYAIKNMIIDALFESDGLELKDKSKTFITCMSMDMNNIELLTSRMMADFILEISTMAVTIYILCKINAVIILSIFLLYPILFIIQRLFNRILQKESKQLLEYIDTENSFVKELSLYIEQFILLHTRNYYLNKFNKNEKLLLNRSLKLNMLLELNSAIPRIISLLGFLIILGISAAMVMNNYIQVGQFTIVLLYTQRLFNPLTSILRVIGQLQKTKISIKRISELL